MWYVYILKTSGKKSLYIGSTNDLQRRIEEHNSGTSKATAPLRPLELISYVAVSSERKARELEKYFKTGSGKTVLKKRILNDEDIATYEVWSNA